MIPAGGPATGRGTSNEGVPIRNNLPISGIELLRVRPGRVEAVQVGALADKLTALSTQFKA